MRLSKKEKEVLLKITDHLTDRTHYYESNDKEANETLYPLFKKLRMEILGY